MPVVSLGHGLKCLLIEFDDLAKEEAFLFGFFLGFFFWQENIFGQVKVVQ